MFVSKPLLTAAALVSTAGVSLFAARLAAVPAIDEFEEMSMGIRVDTADGDIGIQLALEVAEAFLGVVVHDPFGNVLFNVSVSDPSGLAVGLTELAVEAKQPDVASGLDAFPEGVYIITALSVDGGVISTETELSHELPVRPRFLTPVDGDFVNADAMNVEWRAASDIDHYILIVEGENLELTLEVPGDVTSFQVPTSLLERGAEYELDIIAVNDAGNSVVSEIVVQTTR